MKPHKINNGIPEMDFEIKVAWWPDELIKRFFRKFKPVKNMTLREKQSLFLKNISKLILWAFKQGYELTAGEVYRTESQQLLYFEGYELKKIGLDLKFHKTSRKSKTMDSDHRQKMAFDLNLFVNGEYTNDPAHWKVIHKKWKSMHLKNYSGYEWGWDFNHYGMKQ